MSESEKIYVTGDQGRSWRRINLPKEVDEDGFCFFKTHPFDKDFILANCDVTHEKSQLGSHLEKKQDFLCLTERIAYISTYDTKSFRRINAPVDGFEAPPDLGDHGTTCEFATSSKESTMVNHGIYCIHKLEKMSGIQNFWDVNIGENTVGETKSMESASHPKSTLFYTSDFGKTTNTFNELKACSVEKMWILPSKILVLTSENDEFGYTRNRLWISRGDSFKPAHLLEGVTLLPYRWQILLESDPERILIYADLEGNGYYEKTKRLLVSDSSGYNFSFAGPDLEPEADNMRLKKIKDLRGTLWGIFNFQLELNRCNLVNEYKIDFYEKLSWFGKFLKTLKEKIFEKACPCDRCVLPFIKGKTYETTKVSFDGGKTWNSPKVVDPSGESKHLFKCNIDDVEHCSFQEASSYLESGSEPTAGILIKTGNVGKDTLLFNEREIMTFISRDGGASWEVAFEYPVLTAFLDFGNIIIAVPEEDTGLYTKFFFSLDQGMNWKEYYFNEPMHADHILIDSWGLNVVIGFGVEKKEITEYFIYSVNFSKAYNGKACADDDWETWYLSNGNCIDGIRYSFNRRKADSHCLMRKTFEALILNEDMCD